MANRKPQRPRAIAAFIVIWLVVVAGLGGCDPAWDGPGLLAQAGDAVGSGGGTAGGADAFVGNDAFAGPPDIAASPDAGTADAPVAEDVPTSPEDVSPPQDASADVPPPDDVPVPEDVPPPPDGEGPLCPLPGEGTVNPVQTVGLSAEANAEGGIDIDHDATTCAPRSDCTDGVDNALAGAALLFETAVVDLVLGMRAGLVPVVQPLTDDVREGPFRVGLWPAEATIGDRCPDDGRECEMILYAEGGGGSCDPAWVLEDGVLVDGDTVVAGQVGSEHVLEINLVDGIGPLEVSVYSLHIRAKVQLDGSRIVAMTGTLGGAIERIDLLDLLEVAEVELGAWFPILRDVVGLLLDTDIDVDGDGSGDALSFAIKFTASQGRAVSVMSNGLPLWMGQH